MTALEIRKIENENLCAENQENKLDKTSFTKGPRSYGARHTLAILGVICIACNYAMRLNVSVAILAMVNNTHSKNEDLTEACAVDGTKGEKYRNHTSGEFDWDEKTQGLILGAFFYGYTATNILAGLAAEYWGGKIVIGLGMVITAIMTILSPLAAETGTWLLVVARIIEGAASGVLYPGIQSMIASWFPACERSKFSSFIFAGNQLGTMIALPLTGILCDSKFLNGWPSAFYVFGFITLVWAAFWFWLISDDPRDHPRISEAELFYITSNCPKSSKNQERAPVPWKEIFTSIQFWAIVCGNFSNNWIFYTMITELPTYLDRIQHFSIKTNGFLSALPYLGSWIFSIFYSIFITKLHNKGYLSVLSVRRVSMAIGNYGPSIGFLIMLFVDCNSTLAIIVLICGQALNGAIYCGYLSSYVDISPRFAGTLMGVTNTIATIPGFVSPLITGVLTQDNQTLLAWKTVFLIAAVISILINSLYIIFVSADIQPWNDPTPKKTDSEESQQLKNSPFV